MEGLGEVSGVGVVIRVAREYGMECLVDEGWQLEKWRYCWRLVGLTWMEAWS